MLAQGGPHTGSARETLLMNVGPCLSWDEKIDNFIFFSLLAGMDFAMLTGPDVYKRLRRLAFYMKAILPDPRILSFLLHNATSGYFSIRHVARLLRGEALDEKDCQEILTQILKYEYMPEDSAVKQLFTKLSAASRKRENDIVAGALTSLLDALDVD
ncbi:hypothetical protein GCM10023116_40060 [Kistimonas scapharcae]|uniref:Uncharacterized protein n=1 Tax=Kistimonas scapharcae TaxID=1036133 RepID=A0ABP8V9S7_9GAMM